MMDPFDSLLSANRVYVDSGSHRALPVTPALHLTVVTCMDSRIDAFASLGLEIGDAHVIRTAGARVTEDVRRSLALSTHLLGVRSVAVIGHTDCGLNNPDDDLEQRLARAMGRDAQPREWHAFDHVDGAVKRDCAELLEWADRPDGFSVGGYVLDVGDGSIREVAPPRCAGL